MGKCEVTVPMNSVEVSRLSYLTIPIAIAGAVMCAYGGWARPWGISLILLDAGLFMYLSLIAAAKAGEEDEEGVLVLSKNSAEAIRSRIRASDADLGR